jgi:integrase
MGRDRDGVRAASESTCEISFTYMGKRCRERVKIKPTPAGLKKARNFLGAVKEAIEAGTFDYSVSFPKSKRLSELKQSSGVTVGEYISTWLVQIKSRLKASTWQGYDQIAHHNLIPSLGKLPLCELSKLHVKTMMSECVVSASRMSYIQSVLRSALRSAVEDELLEVNIMEGWKVATIEKPDASSDVDPFSRAEQSLVLARLDVPSRNFFQFAFWTGLRPSEAIALDWDDVDWVKQEVRVTKAMTKASNGTAEKPKTRSSVRSVKLLTPAYNSLLNQKSLTFLEGVAIFKNPRTSKRWTEQILRETVWRKAIRLSGVRYRRPYQTRHTYASMMLSAGESPMWVAQQMGHKDWGMIRTIYGKYMPDAIPDAGSKAVEIYGQNAAQNAVITSVK